MNEPGAPETGGIAVLAQVSTDAERSRGKPPPPPSAPDVLPPGTVIARFIVHRVLGAGGAGVVYEAHDPDLDRAIALKLIRSDLADRDDARARFLREAQALARSPHPNVISVYEVGAAGGCVFIAMEYIRGQTFAAWLATSQPAWPQILAVMLKAGRGLTAAHAAHLIHRDFKPSNMLVGNDGRVVVTDFGLARAAETHSEDDAGEQAAGSPRSALAVSITRTGGIQGTPAYMAPEQQRGQTADARADQFSFCVTLYEALFGVHPSSSSAAPRADAPRAPMLRPPSAESPHAGASGVASAPIWSPEVTVRIPRDSRGVPSWLQRAVLRGLSARPEDRYPSMDSLLADLNRGPVRRRRLRLAVATTLAIAAMAAIAINAMTRSSDSELCAGARLKLANVWSASSRAEMRSAFGAAAVPYARDTWRHIEPILDGYSEQWATMHGDACAATRVRGEQSEAVMDRRMACLDTRKHELEELTQLFRRPDADVIEHAVRAAQGLSSIQACGDLAALARPIAPLPDPETAARVTAVRDQLASVHVLSDAGKYADALAIVEKLASDKVAQNYLPVRAELAYWSAELHSLKTAWTQALTSGEDAIWAAEASGHDEIATRSLSQAVTALAELGRFNEARAMVRRGEAALLRAPAPPVIRAQFRTSVCNMLYREDKYAEALEQCEQALELRRRDLGAQHTEVARAQRNVAVLMTSRDPSRALGYFREALAAQEQVLGPEHPEVARVLNAMGIAHRNLGQLDEARACYERALAIDEHSLGADSLPVSEVLLNLANVLTDRKQYAEASVALQRALRIDEDKLGPQHESVATALLSIANVLRRQQDNAGALDKLRRAASIFEATGQSGRTVYANVLLTICSMEVQLERPRDATSPCTRGLAVMERVNGPDSPAVADVLVDPVSSAYAANGMARQALAALERGIAGLPRGNPRVQLRIAVGEIRLAQTLWRYAPAARAQARVLAVRSLEWFREAGADLEAERKEIERWLASRGGVPRRAARVGGAGP